MSSKSLSRKITLLLLGVTLATPWAEAARPRVTSTQPEKVFVYQSIELLGQAWMVLTQLWDKEGCQIDPNGRCITTPMSGPTNTADEGCRIDPSGSDEGCHIDPNGRP